MGNRMTAIIFDWHGVLDLTTYRGFSHFLSSVIGRSPEEIHSVVSSAEARYVVGRLVPADFWQFLEHELALTSKQLGAVRGHLLAVRRNEPLWVMLPTLAQRFTLAILSDCPADKLAAIRATIDLSLFRAAHFSCEQGRAKQHDAFFAALLQELSLAPSECLYVDDTEKHIVTASRLGFQTCSFTAPNDLTACLGEQG